MELVSSKKEAIGIGIRSIIFTWEKMEFVIRKVEEHNLHMSCMEWGGGHWPSVYVKGEKEDIEKLFKDLKKKFFLPPYYLNNDS